MTDKVVIPGTAEWWATDPSLEDRLSYALECAEETPWGQHKLACGWDGEVAAVLKVLRDNPDKQPSEIRP